MVIYPAVDIKDGRCVRLYQGDMDTATDYGEPYEMALKWQTEGAAFIHLVDLNSAFTGGFVNFDAVKKICDHIDIPVQLGGGIRSMADIERRLDDLKITRVIIGTAAVKDPELVKQAVKKYPGRIVIGIDAVNGKVVVEGWGGATGIEASALALKMKYIGVDTIIYTDVTRDGTLSGPNVEATKRMAEKTGMNIIASGGMSRLADVKALRGAGASGVIIGKALYTGAIDLKAAMAE